MAVHLKRAFNTETLPASATSPPRRWRPVSPCFIRVCKAPTQKKNRPFLRELISLSAKPGKTFFPSQKTSVGHLHSTANNKYCFYAWCSPRTRRGLGIACWSIVVLVFAHLFLLDLSKGIWQHKVTVLYQVSQSRINRFQPSEVQSSQCPLIAFYQFSYSFLKKFHRYNKLRSGKMQGFQFI